MTSAGSADARRDELVERLFGSALGALDLLCVYLGDRLGLYKALADTGPSTSAELAGEARVNERYAREWLEQQAMTGILEAVDPDATDAERRYALPDRPRRGPARPARHEPSAARCHPGMVRSTRQHRHGGGTWEQSACTSS